MEVEERARRFIGDLAGGRSAPDAKTALEIALPLRNCRRFPALLDFTNQCAALGLDHPALARLNAHALIERGKLAKAMSLLAALIERTKDDPAEYSQAVGMMGRAHKQIFLDDQSNLDDLHVRASLRNALKFYCEGLRVSEAKADFVWHGVNVAALAKRAKLAGISLPEPIDWQKIAHDVENDILERERRGNISAWNCVNAGEACLALDAPERATEWFARYVDFSSPGEYALHSTLRQLQLLWGIKPDRTPVGKVFAMLQARLYGVERGEITIDNIDLGSLPEAEEKDRPVLERLMGEGGFAIYSSFLQGLSRGKAVARIGSIDYPGVGTGFLVKGSDFGPSWAGERLLLTNAHVVTNDQRVRAQHGALSPDEARVTFTQGAPDRTFRVSEVVWTSPPHDLDASLLRLDSSALESMGVCDISPRLPSRPWAQTAVPVVYVLGHPNGGPLSISLHNNRLIDYEIHSDEDPSAARRVRIHYRTPTEGGSSGSPVFHGDDWQVIGVHHAYSPRFSPLTGEGPPYAANEAIWIQSIIKETRRA